MVQNSVCVATVKQKKGMLSTTYLCFLSFATLVDRWKLQLDDHGGLALMNALLVLNRDEHSLLYTLTYFIKKL